MNIYFYGGMFDPPHRGHYEIVRKCSKISDKFILFPTYKSPKKSKTYVDIKHRLKMLEILFNNLDVFIDDFESSSYKRNYSINTIKYLKNKYTNAKLTMVVGLDQLNAIEGWHEYKKILNEVNILCFNRNCNNDKFSIMQKNYNITFVKNFNYNISSSSIKQKLIDRDEEFLRKFLHLDVVRYIEKNNLYES